MNLLRGVKTRLNERLRPNPDSVVVDVLTGYARWAEDYPPEAHNPLMEIEQQAMLSLFPAVAGKVCLDLACGSGRYGRLLKRSQARQVFGVDYSAEMLSQAKKTDAGFQVARSPFIALPFAAETFDLIICGLSVGHEQDLTQTLSEAARLLRLGGSLLYSDFHPFGALTGWQRAFTGRDGTLFTLEHYPHLYQDHLQACQVAGLSIEAIREPVAGEHAPAKFEGVPVVLAIRATKVG